MRSDSVRPSATQRATSAASYCSPFTAGRSYVQREPSFNVTVNDVGE